MWCWAVPRRCEMRGKPVREGSAMKEAVKKLKNEIDTGMPLTPPRCEELMPLYESVALMRRRFEERIREMKRASEERDAFYGEVQQIRAEHHMAEEIQRSLLPGSAEALRDSHRVDLFADMDTAWEVGGDYYDYFPLDERHLFFSIGDVSGKGIPAAIFSAMIKTAMALSVRSEEELEVVAGGMNYWTALKIVSDTYSDVKKGKRQRYSCCQINEAIRTIDNSGWVGKSVASMVALLRGRF